MINPDTNKFEIVPEHYEEDSRFRGRGYYKQDGTRVKSSTTFVVGEQLKLRGYIFSVKMMEGSEITLEAIRPANPIIVRRRSTSVGASKRRKKSGSRSKKR